MRVVIVGGGILGTMHALIAAEADHEVVHVERDLAPRRASVRNLGLIWVSGRAGGEELDLADRARTKWGEIGAAVPESGFREHPSLTILRTEEEMAVAKEALEAPGSDTRGLVLLTPSETTALNPCVSQTDVMGGLVGRRDAVVESRLALGALRTHCQSIGHYQWRPGIEITDIKDGSVVDTSGHVWSGDRIVVCPGAADQGIVRELVGGEPVRRVRLQMTETRAYKGTLPTSIADGDSLRYYPAYDLPSREFLRPQVDVAAQWAAQLLLVQRLHGGLTIGDTHGYAEPFPFDVDDDPEVHLHAVASSLLKGPVPRIERRWAGVYSQATEEIYLRRQVADGVELVTGLGGRGMTISPAVAEETFAQ